MTVTIIGATDEISLDTYVGIDQGRSQWSTDGTADGNTDDLLLGACLGSVDGNIIVTIWGTGIASGTVNCEVQHLVMCKYAYFLHTRE